MTVLLSDLATQVTQHAENVSSVQALQKTAVSNTSSTENSVPRVQISAPKNHHKPEPVSENSIQHNGITRGLPFGLRGRG
ncbi:hypothetical protein AYI69_g9652 [Smittium culicis]|uniref:Uncharacterized protein n=1 Tax=Smittium culicis TaxID=133412 RepID=A0A1R1XB98_9FUNG|nr:hypothetical protein AYI69_g9652 [Smittium culicis]